MKLTGKLEMLLIGALLFGFSLNGISASKHKITKRKYPIIKIRRKAINSQKFKCNKKEYTVNYITNDKIQLVEESTNAKLIMDQVVVDASRSRYSDGKNTEIHIKRNEAILTRNGNSISCEGLK
ncbi:hypothetical protein HMPREF1552_01048 [Leptotrichia sp. oral taxon 879 str. F0557]|nr:hypothetical protein HMPREF1552_01048 [Leptotrichia sp. oral taxon 879 str. F0557]